MNEIKCTYEEYQNKFLPSISVLGNLDFNISTSFDIQEILEECEKINERFNKAMNGLREKYGEKDEEGKFVKEKVKNEKGKPIEIMKIGDKESFNKEVQELYKKSLKIPVPKIFTPEDLTDAEGNEVMGLKPVIIQNSMGLITRKKETPKKTKKKK